MHRHLSVRTFKYIDIQMYEEAFMKDINTSIAFNIMVHSQPGILELFLALYFRPDNHYVFHLDYKVKFEYNQNDMNILADRN